MIRQYRVNGFDWIYESSHSFTVCSDNIGYIEAEFISDQMLISVKTNTSMNYFILKTNGQIIDLNSILSNNLSISVGEVIKCDESSIYYSLIYYSALGYVCTEYQRYDLSSYLTDNDTLETPLKPTLSIYPNPFNPSTHIQFNVLQQGMVQVDIFNIKGQLVKTLFKDHLSKGTQSLVWNGKDNQNKTVSSGIYFTRIKQPGHCSNGKMMLIK